MNKNILVSLLVALSRKQVTSMSTTFLEVSDAIDALSNEERKAVRAHAENAGAQQLPRNLYYNYTTQEWID